MLTYQDIKIYSQVEINEDTHNMDLDKHIKENSLFSYSQLIFKQPNPLKTEHVWIQTCLKKNKKK